MSITRRAFVGSAAAALMLPRMRASTSPRCTVLDLGDRCALRESVAGYRAALANAQPGAPVLVIPGALDIPVLEISDCLWRGGTVILEAGELPVSLWPRRTPYIDFTWPVDIAVRDFSNVAPVHVDHAKVIATADGIAVASRRRIGLGTLIHLGTPLGPALWAGDAEAKQWLSAVVRTTKESPGGSPRTRAHVSRGGTC